MALTKIDDRGLKTPIDLLDNEKIRLGTGNDIEFYHDGSNSKIVHSGTGGLYIGADTFGLQNGTTDENYIVMSDNGSVDIYHDNVKVFNTDANGIMVKGQEGGSANVYIYADEGDDNDDKFQLTVDNGGPFHIQNRGSGSVETNIKCYGNGAVELYYDGVKMLETYANGVKLPQGVNSHLWLTDSGKVMCGTGTDLQIYHDGTNSYVSQVTAGQNLFLKGDAVQIRSASNEQIIETGANGAVQLYYDNSKKLETTSDGVKISDSTLEIADTTCLIDLMETSATNHRIRNGNGNFYIQKISDDKSTTTTQIQVDGGTGAVNLYHNGAGPKFETYSSGIKVTGVVRGGTSGFGIDFAETSNASGMTSEVLDDYEEGSWTPVLSNDGTAFDSISNSSSGHYTKIGNVVTITMYHRTDGVTKGSASDTDNVLITGLPFTPSSSIQRTFVPIGFNVNWAQYPNQALIVEGNAQIELYKYASSGGHNTGTRLTVAAVNTGGNSNYCLLTMVYRT